ncbi:acyl-CoA dehydrogenase family protein [Paenibacillus sp. FJAT-27812]|uniref:acyl-CoA dehydrogenase family protein n=1 Tax=Paenibacillus sp. FJAT-27812 TaxID=1684143 RepID=UPI0006A7C4D3|nr:acyl-CoA dehydrogenase family protein [Paenibacillus sp. FJAT-27812]
MQFCISEELELTRSVIREFAESEVTRRAGERDELEQFERKLFNRVAELGLTAIPIDESSGGAGSDWLTYAVVLEELSRVCASTSASLAAHTVYAAWPLYKFGSKETHSLFLKELASGSRLGACAPLSKQGNNSIRAHKTGRDWELNGGHSLVLQAEAADHCVVYAQTGSGKRKNDYSVFLVESGTSGFIVGNKVSKLGLRSFMTAEVTFEHCIVTANHRIGHLGQGQEIATSLIDISHISAAAQAVGIAQGALEAAAAYAKERKQFGLLIGNQQGISFKLADMSAKTEAARLLTYQAAWRMDEGLSCRREAALARRFAADTAVAAAIEAIQIFGGYGYMQEYRMERYLRDAKCLETEVGTGGMETDLFYRMLTE